MKKEYSKEHFEINKKIAQEILGINTIDETLRIKDSLDETRVKSFCDEAKRNIASNQYDHEVRALETDKKWELFKKRAQPRRNIYILATKIAAVLILPFAIYGIIQVTNNERVMVAEQNTIDVVQPGSAKAILILGNGKQISIDTSTDTIIKTANHENLVAKGATINYSIPKREKRTTQVSYNTIVTPKGGEFQITLEDGTKVWLNANSSLRYPCNFTENKRTVEMTGEAYFEVTHTGQSFTVISNKNRVEVLGTRFNIENRTDGNTYTTLIEGRVAIESSSTKQLLQPNQRGIINEYGDIELVESDDMSHYIAWVNGTFMFEEADLDYIMERLALWYNVDVSFNDDLSKQMLFSLKLKRYKEISEVLDLIEMTDKVKFSYQNDTIFVTKK